MVIKQKKNVLNMNIYENNYVGEPVKITDKAASFTEEYKYDPIGNKVSAKGNDGAEYKYEYDQAILKVKLTQWEIKKNTHIKMGC